MHKNLQQPTIILGFILMSIIFLSYGTSHPTSGTGGNTGAPGDGVCSNCHTPGTTNNGDMSITGIPGVILPNTTYPITITATITNGDPTFAGFQVVSLLNSDNSNAGIWTNNSTNTSIKSAGGKSYFGHQPKTAFSGNTSISWTADWTSPTVNNDDNITFYGATNFANGSGSSGDKIVFSTVTGSISSTVPIKLTSFNLINNSDFTELRWSSETEFNFNYYSIQRSRNNKDWIEVGIVHGKNKGNSTNYIFKDQHKYNDFRSSDGTIYYRLESIDNDGSSSYSKVLSTYFHPKETYSVYPTVVLNELNIDAGTYLNPKSIKIFNFNHKLVKEISWSQSTSLKSINLDHLQTGSYILLIYSENSLFTSKFVKI